MHIFFIKQFSILFSNELKNIFLKKRALFAIMIYTGILFLVFWGVSKSREFSYKMIGQMKLEPAQELIVKQSLDNFKIPYELQKEVPLFKNPWPVVIYFLISMCTLPFLIALISCDMISSDLYSGTQRFLLFRVGRAVYFSSKFFSHFILYNVLQFLILSMLYILCFVFFRDTFSLYLIKSGLILSLKLIPVIFAFLALCQSISSQISGPVKSLIVNNLAIISMFMLLAFKPGLSLFYGPLWNGLMGGNEPGFIFSLLGFGAWGAGFLTLSYYFFWLKKL